MQWFQEKLTPLAFCWRLTRRDGVRLGFTSHDQDLEVDGLIYRASPGMVPSAIEASDGFDASSVDLSGALTSDAITADDLAAGRWDGAQLLLSANDWTQAEVDPVFLARGELGAISQEDDSFTAELRGPTTVLDAPVVEETSPLCRAKLGDARCRVDMAGRQRFASVIGSLGNVLTVGGSHADGDYAFGKLRWISGKNSGLESWIDASTGGQLVLREAPRFAVIAGDLVELIEGCDRQFSTCRTRFANAANFRGEPHLPGNDLLTRYAS
jgi:uncharacterized phage protein (TIGR02218 family)